MKNFSLKALGAFIFAAGLVVAGVAAPAQASVPLTSPSVTSTGAVSGSTNPNPITISMTAVTDASSHVLLVEFPTGWTWVSPDSTQFGCSPFSAPNAWVTSVSNFAPTLICANDTSNQTGNNARLWLNKSGQTIVPIVSGTQIQVVIPANAMNVGSGTDFKLSLVVQVQGQTVRNDESIVALNASPAPAPNPVDASAELTLNASTGQLVAGSSVAVVASGLQATAPYEVVVRSTPQTIGSGNAVSGAVNTSVTLPAGLEAGWHSLTFSSTAADGSAMTSVAYFKVSASGTLLATSTTIPAELANTGVDSTSAILLLAGGLSLALVGAEMFMIARRKRSN